MANEPPVPPPAPAPPAPPPPLPAPPDPDEVQAAVDKLAKAAEEAAVAAAAAQVQAHRQPAAAGPAVSPYRSPAGGARGRKSKRCGGAAVRTAPSATATSQASDAEGDVGADAPDGGGGGGSGGDGVSRQLTAAISAEAQAREHLRKMRARVQRELARASSMAALEDVRERKRQVGASTRAELDRQIGRDLTRKIAEDMALGKVEPASEEEVRASGVCGLACGCGAKGAGWVFGCDWAPPLRASLLGSRPHVQVRRLSELLNQRLLQLYPDGNSSFFSLFKHMDVDGSRRVSFREFSMLLREELRLSKSVLPLARLHALWATLDENASGFVDAGELGRFMRLGRPEAALGSRVRTPRRSKRQPVCPLRARASACRVRSARRRPCASERFRLPLTVRLARPLRARYPWGTGAHCDGQAHRPKGAAR